MQETRKREIRIKADSFRANCKIGRYGIIDLFKECERMGYKLLRYPLGENADLGFMTKRDNDIVIFTNSCSRLSREIFTLAHEIGHVILHLNDSSSFIDDSITINGRSTDEKEQEANYFAACLLMPLDDIHRFIDLEIQDFQENGLSAMDIARIMSEFNVSFDMALNRLESLDVIDTNQKTRLDNAKTEMKVGNLLRGVGGNSKLNVSSEEIDIPYEYIDYVIYNYNHNAVPKETLERVLACYGLSIDDVNDKIITPSEDEDDLDDLIGGLDD
ncbi:MAG: ImmA/IrrE family metallo-endopeptidase [Lachnospiraceae bacterium]|nr:ImmA/IrrE family metallo-endopeptidase [Lachnospiraceae bacterium]